MEGNTCPDFDSALARDPGCKCQRLLAGPENGRTFLRAQAALIGCDRGAGLLGAAPVAALAALAATGLETPQASARFSLGRASTMHGPSATALARHVSAWTRPKASPSTPSAGPRASSGSMISRTEVVQGIWTGAMSVGVDGPAASRAKVWLSNFESEGPSP